MSLYAHHLIHDQRIWQKLEDELVRDGFRMPLFHRLPWVERNPQRGYALVSLQDQAGHPAAQIVLQSDVSRVLPGHKFLRVLRFGDNLSEPLLDPMVKALKQLVVADTRVLRLSVGVFSRERRAAIASSLERHGFQKSPAPQSYSHTLSIDLTPSVDGILQGLHKSGRKNLKEAEKAGLPTILITDPIYADRITELQREALARTGGDAEIFDWRENIELSRTHPGLSRIVALFSTPGEFQPENLQGFAWGCRHTDNVEYRAGGTTRVPGRRISISYPLLWNLILWSKETGAGWFDLGGITFEDTPGTDPLAGISDFKRFFSRTVEEVGEEWILEPHPARTRLAAAAGQGARALGSLVTRIRQPRSQGVA